MHSIAAAAMAHPLANPISPDHLLASFGLVGLAVILFAECGLLVGFFLPGDTLLFAAGIKIAVDAGQMSPLAAYLIVAPLAAIAGNLVGYWIGYRAGPVVFDRPDSRLFRPEYVTRSQSFFDRFGAWTIILGRFVPIVRTVATVMAGVARMRFSVYTVWTIIGGFIWADGVLLLGHQLGKIKFVQDNKGYIDYAVVAVVVLSLLPAAVHYWQGRRRTSS
jgi:membrane-associated protein